MGAGRPGGDGERDDDEGDHPFVRHASHLSFPDARVAEAAHLLAAAACDSPLLTRRASASAELLERVRRGLESSRFTPVGVVEFCAACRQATC